MATDSTPSLEGVPAVEPIKYHVLMMTAAVLSFDATSEAEAALVALQNAPHALDPSKLDWVVKHISTVPIELAGEGPTNAEQPAGEAVN